MQTFDAAAETNDGIVVTATASADSTISLDDAYNAGKK